MNTETYQLIDTALKIGLGALISGLASYLAIGKKYSVDKLKSNLEFRRELLVKLAENFELVDDGVDKIAIDFRSHYNKEKDNLDMSLIKQCAAESFKYLRIVRANANLLGFKELHENLDKYSNEINEFINCLEEFKDTGNEDSILESFEKMTHYKKIIYPQISKGLEIINEA